MLVKGTTDIEVCSGGMGDIMQWFATKILYLNKIQMLFLRLLIGKTAAIIQ